MRVRACTQLNLRANKLGAEAIGCICEGLNSSSSITTLDLGANALGAEGATALANGGAFASSLTQARVLSKLVSQFADALWHT